MLRQCMVQVHRLWRRARGVDGLEAAVLILDRDQVFLDELSAHGHQGMRLLEDKGMVRSEVHHGADLHWHRSCSKSHLIKWAEREARRVGRDFSSDQLHRTSAFQEAITALAPQK